ncbi:MAG TPA: XrtA/PEP-CTERM system histidine kinase PrsK, partial [Rhodopila sp.]|nr:XrtA/PEP-CTERM system histidine kinase PrsK [Rhodopila sp.]
MIELPAIYLLYGITAAIYAGLAALTAVRGRINRTSLWLGLAFAMTAAWSAATALSRWLPVGPAVPWLEIGRVAVWYGFILHLYRTTLGARDHLRTIFQPAGVLALSLLSATLFLARYGDVPFSAVGTLGISAHIGLIVCVVLLLENLYRNTPPDTRWNINLLCVGLGSIFIYDLVLYADAALFHRLSFALIEARASAAILAAPLLGIAVVRNRRWSVEIRVSHDVAFHSFTLIGSGIFLLAVALIGEVVRRAGSEWGNVAEASLILAAVLAVLVVITSGSARSAIRSVVVENFFAHRYDYRKEWMRCINTLTAPEAFVALHKRAIRAAAEVVDSPAGALFVRPPADVAFQWAGSWNMPAATASVPPGHPIVPLFKDGEWIVGLDEHADADSWFPELPRAWIVLPLSHFGALIGFVVLARPRANFKLDREAYDLLRVVGREIASRVAEQRAVQVLTQTRQLREYSQRFAFVIHDIKNVSGQLSMLLTNAEVYAENPAFQRDMLTTVRASVGKITRLLSRLEADRQERHHALITPADRLRVVIETCRATHARAIQVVDQSGGAGAAIDPDA